MSLPASELVITAGSEYDKTTRTFGQPWESTWGSKDSTYRSPELKSTNIGVSEDYTLSVDRARTIPDTLKEPVGFVLIGGSLKELVLSLLKELGAPVLDVEVRYGEGIGLYALAILDCNARQALEYWLKIADKAKGYEISVFVMWTGSVDVTPEEMGTYIGKVLAKMNVFLATKELIDVVRILRGE